MSTINFTHLKLLAIFATVIESGSFAAAARSLKSSRSRVSEQVSQLEEVLGVRLLQRSTRQLLATREGKDVYDQAKELSGLLLDVESAVTATEPRGRVTVTMNHDMAHKIFLPLLQEFLGSYPLISLDLILDDAKTDLIAEQVDLAIRIGLPSSDSLIGRVLHEESFGLFASSGYVEEFGIPQTIKELESRSWILLSLPTLESNFLFRKKNKLFEIKPKNFHLCNSPLMMQHMTVEGLGISALLPSMLSEEIAQKRVVNIMPSVKSEPLVFSLVYPSRRHVPQRTRVLIDFLRERSFSEEG